MKKVEPNELEELCDEELEKLCDEARLAIFETISKYEMDATIAIVTLGNVLLFILLRGGVRGEVVDQISKAIQRGAKEMGIVRDS